MRCACLKCLTVMHESLDGICILSARKFIAWGLFALDNRDGEVMLMEIGINAEHALCFFYCLIVCPSCQRNSLVRRKGRVVFSQRTTLHH